MYTQTFISSVIQSAKNNDNFEQLRAEIPLGIDMTGNVITAQKYNGAVAWKHICITGNRRVECICNLLITLSCFYEKSEANFIILSPRLKYAELLGLHNMNAIVPYVRNKNDLNDLKVGLRDILYMQMQGKGLPKLFLVLDGFEELSGCDAQELKEYNDILQSLMKVPNTQVISGVNLMKSMYSGCPGAFVGIGNCLVTTREDGKADVTYVGDDTNLSLPVLIDFPCQPSVQETIRIFNGVSLETAEEDEKDELDKLLEETAETEEPAQQTAQQTVKQTNVVDAPMAAENKTVAEEVAVSAPAEEIAETENMENTDNAEVNNVLQEENKDDGEPYTSY